MGQQTALHLRGRIGLPHIREMHAAQQLREHLGIDLVGLHLRLSDRFRLQWIAHDELSDTRTQNVHNGPRARRRIQRDAVRLPQLLSSELLQLVPTAIDATAGQDFSFAIDHTHFNELLVNVPSHESNHGKTSTVRRCGKCSRQRAMGILQLPLRAQGSVGWVAGWPVKKPGSKPIAIGGQPPR